MPMPKHQYPFRFAEVPAIGTALIHGREGVKITLEKATPHTRQDGTAGTILTWRAEDGRIGTSGLCSAGITWAKPSAPD